MAGENLRDSTMEVALEQWTEHEFSCSRLHRHSHVTGRQYNFVLAESRVLPLKTGGTAE